MEEKGCLYFFFFFVLYALFFLVFSFLFTALVNFVLPVFGITSTLSYAQGIAIYSLLGLVAALFKNYK